MSTEKNEVVVQPAVEPPATSYHEAAQALLEQIRKMRESIPHFTVPNVKGGRRALASVASVSPEFIEATTVARTNNEALVRGGAVTPGKSRDLLAFAEAYTPVADEFEAIAQFVRFSTDAAKSKAAYEALTTYAIARRLVTRPEHADLVPYVADMQRTLGNRIKRLKAAALARKQKQSAAATPPASSTEEK